MVSGVVATPVDHAIVHDLFSLGSSFYVPPKIFFVRLFRRVFRAGFGRILKVVDAPAVTRRG
jgi:hypothetical protein